MSDDLFWPPLSGDDEDRPRAGEPATPDRQPISEADGGYPTAAYPTVPLVAAGHESDGTAGSGGSGSGKGVKLGAVGMVAVTAFVFGVGGVAVGAELLNNGNGNTAVTSDSVGGGAGSSALSTALTTSPKSYAGIAARVLPSVVSVNVTGSSESDTGSGVILRDTGYILTNNHVVAAAANGGSISVSLNDGSTASAKIIGTDSLDDLAVIKISSSGLTAATLGDSSAIAVGDPVLAVGSPLGLTGTVTSGIVSALNRPVETQDESQTQSIDPFGAQPATTNPTVIDAIQTDAAINPGNSGGALVDAQGEVVGINSAIASLGSSSLSGTQSGNIGVGFAIPINQARIIADELIASGHATHPLLGVALADKTASNGTDQAIVKKVTSGGPAASAGIKDGDVITAVGAQQTEGADAVIAAIRSHQPGEKVAVTFLRSNATHTVTATLATDPSTQG